MQSSESQTLRQRLEVIGLGLNFYGFQQIAQDRADVVRIKEKPVNPDANEDKIEWMT